MVSVMKLVQRSSRLQATPGSGFRSLREWLAIQIAQRSPRLLATSGSGFGELERTSVWPGLTDSARVT